MLIHAAEHLSKEKKVQFGGYYTPPELVAKIYALIRPYLSKNKKAVIFDSAGGCGAFLTQVGRYDYRIADCDEKACAFLRDHFDKKRIFQTNSLVDVRRGRYSIPENAFLVMVGNPPYNDTTSEFRSGEKGAHSCDHDLRDRDLGISFLRSYEKLGAEVVCILHPLSYLIKKANFMRLREFKEHYQLIQAEIFSSAVFAGTGSGKFPVAVALYERRSEGMSYEDIQGFRFRILNGEKTFVLKNYRTTDGYIHKYPPRKNEPKESPIGLYYYTFRDLNSLKKNASFLNKPHYNGIVVTLENFYRYAYLYAVKSLFAPKDPWLYGNLSPLCDPSEVEKNKRSYVAYALRTNDVLKKISPVILSKISKFYGLDTDRSLDRDTLKQTLSTGLGQLILEHGEY